jgi:hypothetical protein
MRPVSDTAVASSTSRPAPDSARCPRWTMCQSPADPSSAEYWHIGATTMRLGDQQRRHHHRHARRFVRRGHPAQRRAHQQRRHRHEVQKRRARDRAERAHAVVEGQHRDGRRHHAHEEQRLPRQPQALQAGRRRPAEPGGADGRGQQHRPRGQHRERGVLDHVELRKARGAPRVPDPAQRAGEGDGVAEQRGAGRGAMAEQQARDGRHAQQRQRRGEQRGTRGAHAVERPAHQLRGHGRGGDDHRAVRGHRVRQADQQHHAEHAEAGGAAQRQRPACRRSLRQGAAPRGSTSSTNSSADRL